MRIVVGLGNPGAQYVGTRHNVGFEVLDLLANRLGWTGKPADFDSAARQKFDGLALDGLAALPSGRQEKLLLLKPTTFMNLSGNAVQSAMAFYQLPPMDGLIVLDDLALPCGRIRLRAGGSSGGHNGLRDIEQSLSTEDYPRLRLGIDPAPPEMAGKDYVLGKFSSQQRKLLEPAIGKAAEAIVRWMDDGIESAMNEFNVNA